MKLKRLSCLLFTSLLVAACGGGVAEVGADSPDGAVDSAIPQPDGGPQRDATRPPLVDGGEGPLDVTMPPRDTGRPPPPDDASVDPNRPDRREPPEAGRDTAPPPPVDSGPPGVACGTVQCAPSELCCVTQVGGNFTSTCAASCGDAGITVGCDSPDDCETGKVCCGEIPLGGGNFPQCSLSTANSKCQSKCDSKVPFSCNDSIRLQACSVGDDCTKATSGFGECCTIDYQGVSLRACVNSLIKLGLGNALSDCSSPQ